MKLLTDGDQGVRAACRWLAPSARSTDELLAEQMLTCVSASGNGDGWDRFGAGRRDGFDPAGAGAAADAIDEIRCGSKLALHHRPANQRVVHRQHADGGEVARVGLVRLHLLLRVQLEVVQIEGERRRSFVGRYLDEDAGRRIAAGNHFAERDLRLHADAERRRTSVMSGTPFLDRRGGRRRLLGGRLLGLRERGHRDRQCDEAGREAQRMRSV